MATVILLQVITLLIVVGNKKQGGAPGVKRLGVPGDESRSDKGSSDPRRGGNDSGRRPGSENKDRSGRPQHSRPQGQGQQQSPAAAIDPMEKSLRDINLRLKNAEREQENARKKFQENREDARPQRGERGERGGRDGGQGGRRDFNRDKRPDRPKREFEGAGPSAPEPASADGLQERQQHPRHEQASAPAMPDIAVNDFGVSDDQLQHGRKFTAKRRQLPQEAEGAPESAGTASENTAPEVQSAESGEIQYGR